MMIKNQKSEFEIRNWKTGAQNVMWSLCQLKMIL